MKVGRKLRIFSFRKAARLLQALLRRQHEGVGLVLDRNVLDGLWLMSRLLEYVGNTRALWARPFTSLMYVVLYAPATIRPQSAVELCALTIKQVLVTNSNQI